MVVMDIPFLLILHAMAIDYCRRTSFKSHPAGVGAGRNPCFRVSPS
jgi:hypothetical protein